MYQSSKKKGTAEQNIGGIKQFYSLFEYQGAEGLDPVVVFVDVYKKKLIADLLKLPIMDPSLTTTRKICGGLKKLPPFCNEKNEQTMV